MASIFSVVTGLSAAGAGWFKLFVERSAQEFRLRMERQQQNHAITKDYLNLALNQQTPLAIRQQILRFLASPGDGETKLEGWAKAELAMINPILEALNKNVAAAAAAQDKARTPIELAEAKHKLDEAVRRRNTAVAAPALPPVSAASVQSGFYLDNKKDLIGVDLSGQDMAGGAVAYSVMVGANLSDANCRRMNFQGCDLRGANFERAVLRGALFYAADLRDANLQSADLCAANLQQARLEGADLRGAKLDKADVRAVYDEATRWPDGFDPVSAGGVSMTRSVAEAGGQASGMSNPGGKA